MAKVKEKKRPGLALEKVANPEEIECCHCKNQAEYFTKDAYEVEPGEGAVAKTFKPGPLRGFCEDHKALVRYIVTGFSGITAYKWDEDAQAFKVDRGKY